MVPLKDRKS